MRAPTFLLAVFVSGVLVGNLTSKYLLVEVDETPVTKIAGIFYCKHTTLIIAKCKESNCEYRDILKLFMLPNFRRLRYRNVWLSITYQKKSMCAIFWNSTSNIKNSLLLCGVWTILWCSRLPEWWHCWSQILWRKLLLRL